MSRSHLSRPVRDSEGNLVPNTKVTIYEKNSTQLCKQKLYNSPSGTTVLDNPFTTSSGVIDFYLDQPQSVKIGVSSASSGGNEQSIDDLDVLPPPNEVVRADVAFEITNGGSPGQFLQSGLTERQAQWVDAADIVMSRPTALTTIKQYDFSSSYLDDLTLTAADSSAVPPVYANVTTDTKPVGYTFLQALQFPTGVRTKLTTPGETWPERGFVRFLYKVVPGAGLGTASLRVAADDESFYVDTPIAADLAGVWRVGYLTGVPAGSHVVTIEHRPGADPASMVLLGPVWLLAGDNIPDHTHAGAGANSTRLGTNSTADYDGSTVMGASAKGLGTDATVFGAYSQAAQGGVAMGRGVAVSTSSVGIGYLAGGSLLHFEWVAIGRQAHADGDSAVAIGTQASAPGARSVAIGAQAATGGQDEAVALGASATASGYRSVALGADAHAPYDYSVAIGPGVATTAAHEARIGDSSTVVVMPGSLRQVGPSGVYGSAASKIGFYGNPGITKPTVQGSRQNNAVLAQLLTALANMGLIKDASTP